MTAPIHPRTVITLALIAKLRNPAVPGGEYPTQVGDNVNLNWPMIITDLDLPKIIVWADPETIEGEAYQGVPLRVLQVSVGILATGSDVPEIDQLLDSIALEVERALLADVKLKDDNGWAWTKDINLSLGADKYIGLDEASRLVGSLEMQFRIEYAFAEDVTGSLDQFLRFRGELILEPYLHPEQGEIDAEADHDYETW